MLVRRQWRFGLPAFGRSESMRIWCARRRLVRSGGRDFDALRAHHHLTGPVTVAPFSGATKNTFASFGQCD